jgi:amino acid permease-like protein
MTAIPDGFTGDWEHERAHLRKSFFRLDIAAFLVCALVGLDTLGTVASNGPQGLVWLLFLAIFFFLPYGLLAAELGSSFPFEGGPYIWTNSTCRTSGSTSAARSSCGPAPWPYCWRSGSASGCPRFGRSPASC